MSVCLNYPFSPEPCLHGRLQYHRHNYMYHKDTIIGGKQVEKVNFYLLSTNLYERFLPADHSQYTNYWYNSVELDTGRHSIIDLPTVSRATTVVIS